MVLVSGSSSVTFSIGISTLCFAIKPGDGSFGERPVRVKGANGQGPDGTLKTIGGPTGRITDIKTPNTKLQTPKKSQAPNPNSARDVAGIGACDVELFWCLELGFWSFHPGFWSFDSKVSIAPTPPGSTLHRQRRRRCICRSR